MKPKFSTTSQKLARLSKGLRHRSEWCCCCSPFTTVPPSRPLQHGNSYNFLFRTLPWPPRGLPRRSFFPFLSLCLLKTRPLCAAGNCRKDFLEGPKLMP